MTLTSSKPKNILYIPSATSGTGIAGGEVYLLSVMRHLDRNLYNPIVLLPGDEGGFRATLNELSAIVKPLITLLITLLIPNTTNLKILSIVLYQIL